MFAWLRRLRRPVDKTVTAYAQIAKLPDEPALCFPPGHELAGQSRRAHVTKQPKDAAKLSLDKPAKAEIVAFSRKDGVR